jgi:hypothetical protein
LHPCGRDRRARDAVFVERQVDPTHCAPSLCSDSEHRTRSNKHRSRTVELSTRSWLAHLGQPAAQLQLTLTHITVHVDDGCTVPGTVTRSRPRSRPARISIDVESTCSPRRPSSIVAPSSRLFDPDRLEQLTRRCLLPGCRWAAGRSSPWPGSRGSPRTASTAMANSWRARDGTWRSTRSTTPSPEESLLAIRGCPRAPSDLLDRRAVLLLEKAG